ncbi:carboxypeptidase-like regulatory domain-containing protein [Chlorogloeopsis sp. ULAP02]|uniref:carboxypeptidase-like regulatory domain-containing protein n=1 Tax=Chlorogloeopsis sp. ULAP02 TaxID=3107926 RepID=UPI0031373DEF
MPKPQTITYTGRIVDNKKQAPILGAKVTFVSQGNSIVCYTDIEGIYQLEINTNKSDSIHAKLTIEANGYKTYYSSIKVSPKQKDLGDIKLLEHHEIKVINSYPETDTFIPIPIIATILAGLFMITILALQTSNSKTPVNKRNDSINIYQP